MTTLSDIVQQVAVDTGIVDKFTATGGSTTTVVNSAFQYAEDIPDSETFKGNYIVVHRDSAGAGGAPEGEWSRISDTTAYNSTTWTITVDTAFSVAPASGDTIYHLKQSIFTLQGIIDAVNRATKDLGVYTFKDITSITIASGQTEYTLPTGVLELLDVQIQTSDDSDDNAWQSIPGCYIIPDTSAMASTPLIYIPQQTTGYDIQLVYKGYHPKVYAYNSVIYKFIPERLLVAATKVALLEEYISARAGQASAYYGTMYQEALRQKNEGLVMSPIQQIAKKKKFGLIWPSVN